MASRHEVLCVHKTDRSNPHERITHIGGPTVLIQFGGWRLLTDPTFDPPGQKYNFGWAQAP